MKTPKELQTLKEKMRKLQSGDFEVEAENPKIVKCWERLNCRRKNCPAYGKLRCWSIAGTSCHGEVLGRFAHELGDCRKCPVYMESRGDEIGELIEIFNQMAKDIRYNVDERVRSGEQAAEKERFDELTDLVAGVAHETRNPLHSIGMATSFLKKKYPDDEQINEFLTIIEDEVRKLTDLTSIFMNFSHPTPLTLESLDINTLVRSAIDDLTPRAAQLKVSILFQADEELPEIVTDGSRIRTCVTNLIENGLEASSEGARVRVRTTAADGKVQVSVQDNGPGIATDEQEKIFKPFYTTKTQGPGLGLAAVERSLRELRGTVEVDSRPGRGATFTIGLPTGRRRPAHILGAE